MTLRGMFAEDLSVPAKRGQVYLVYVLQNGIGKHFYLEIDFLTLRTTRTWVNAGKGADVKPEIDRDHGFTDSGDFTVWVEGIMNSIKVNMHSYGWTNFTIIDLYDFVSDRQEMEALDTRPAF